MIGKWNLTEVEMDKWLALENHYTKLFKDENIKIVDLTHEDITPYQTHTVFLKSGWEHYDQKSDLERGYWDYYRREGSRDAVIYSNGMTFELAIYLKENEKDIEFKGDHAREMCNVDK